jgi:hypothetical protein
MIVKKTVYGIWLTDEFGYPMVGVTPEDMDIVKKYVYKGVKGLTHCPSVEKIQYVLGFEVEINKNTDLKALEQRWIDEMTEASSDLREIAYRLKSLGKSDLDTNVHFLSGHC